MNSEIFKIVDEQLQGLLNDYLLALAGEDYLMEGIWSGPTINGTRDEIGGWLIKQLGYPSALNVRAYVKQPNGSFRKPQKRDYRLAIFERDGNECVECGATENLTVDHIVPISKGGTEVLENLQTLCKSCNSKKGNRL